MNIEEAIENLKIYMKVTNEQIENGELFLDSIVNTEKIQIKSIETLLTAYEKEKEKNKRAEELYMQHNQMIIDILKECNYMIKNRYYMNDTAIRQHAEDIKNIAKYYIKQPEWEEE